MATDAVCSPHYAGQHPVSSTPSCLASVKAGELGFQLPDAPTKTFLSCTLPKAKNQAKNPRISSLTPLICPDSFHEQSKHGGTYAAGILEQDKLQAHLRS